MANCTVMWETRDFGGDHVDHWEYGQHPILGSDGKFKAYDCSPPRCYPWDCGSVFLVGRFYREGQKILRMFEVIGVALNQHRE